MTLEEAYGLTEGDLQNLIQFLWEVAEAEDKSDEGRKAERQATFLERLDRGYALIAQDEGRFDGMGRIMWPPEGTDWDKGYQTGIPAPIGTVVVVLPGGQER